MITPEQYLQDEQVSDLSNRTIKEVTELAFQDSALKEFYRIGSRYAEECNQCNVAVFYDYITSQMKQEVLEGGLYQRIVAQMNIMGTLINEKKRVLDIGCGTGIRTVYYAMQNPDSVFVGIDISKKSLQAAKERAEKRGLRNISFVHANMLSLPFNRSFDAIIAEHSLYETNEDDDPLLERKIPIIADRLKDGLVVITLHPESIYSYKMMMPRIFQDAGLHLEEFIEVPYICFADETEDIMIIGKK
ncbi:MAG: class I SAM-dependent methyltransferase [Nanoarchaeota archaeon]